MRKLIDNEDGATTGEWFPWYGGWPEFRIHGTMGGGNVQIEARLDGATDDIGAAQTTTGVYTTNTPLAACEIRAVVAGGSPTGITVLVS